MRILHVISDLDPAAGGPPMVVSRLAAAQADLGHDVGIVMYEAPAASEHVNEDLRQVPGGMRIVLHRVPEPSRVEWVFSLAFRAALRRLVPAHDVVHIHGIWDPCLRAAASVARQSRKPYVIAPHGMLDVWALSEKSLKKRIAMACGYRSMIRSASMLHVLSDYERECVVETGLNPKVEIIPNGVFMTEFERMPARGTFHAMRPELQGRPYILFLARLHEVKGLDILADAFASVLTDLPDTRLVIAGPDFGARDPLIRQVRRLGIADRVHVVGALYGRDKIAALGDAACFVLPSKHEGFSMSIAEALAAAVPVVISRQCHFPEVNTASAGLVVERDAASLAAALREVLSNASLRQRMGEAGRTLIESKYTWPKVADRSIALYGQVALPGSR